MTPIQSHACDGTRGCNDDNNDDNNDNNDDNNDDNKTADGEEDPALSASAPEPLKPRSSRCTPGVHLAHGLHENAVLQFHVEALIHAAPGLYNQWRSCGLDLVQVAHHGVAISHHLHNISAPLHVSYETLRLVG